MSQKCKTIRSQLTTFLFLPVPFKDKDREEDDFSIIVRAGSFWRSFHIGYGQYFGKDTTWHMNDIQQMSVTDRQGDSLGQVHDIILDKAGNIDYLILSRDDGKLTAIPWKAANMKMWGDKLVVGFSKDKLMNAPTFGANDMPSFDQSFDQRIMSYYGE